MSIFTRLDFPLLLSPADVAEHVRMDVQPDIGHFVNVLAGHQPLVFRRLN
jgi:hypothetical protein